MHVDFREEFSRCARRHHGSMMHDAWLRAILVIVVLALLLRAASALLADTARAWYEARKDIARYMADDPTWSPPPSKPWYVKLHEWGRW